MLVYYIWDVLIFPFFLSALILFEVLALYQQPFLAVLILWRYSVHIDSSVQTAGLSAEFKWVLQSMIRLQHRQKHC